MGGIRNTEHRIDLKPSAKPFLQLPYTAGPKPREEDPSGGERMLRAGVINLLQLPLVSSVVLVLWRLGPAKFHHNKGYLQQLPDR